MNDDTALGAVRDFLATARDSLTEVHMDTPPDMIVRKGRGRRRRHRLAGAAGALAGMALVALALTTLLAAGQADHQATARLAAWTVTRQANGDVTVTISQLQDPAGLQATLQADGVPANVSFSGPPVSPACDLYRVGTFSESAAQLNSVVQLDPGDQSAILVIQPSALPSGTGLAIYDRPGEQLPPGSSFPFPLGVGLVYASQQCTGSS
jgi:hypothetical protein